MRYSHYIPAIAIFDPEQGYRAACGAAASEADFSAEPTCPDCLAWLEMPAPERVDPVSHAAHTIHVASGDLLDLALSLTDASKATQLREVAEALRARLDAVIECSGQKAAELSQEASCPF